jgi:hypothetical protein
MTIRATNAGPAARTVDAIAPRDAGRGHRAAATGGHHAGFGNVLSELSGRGREAVDERGGAEGEGDARSGLAAMRPRSLADALRTNVAGEAISPRLRPPFRRWRTERARSPRRPSMPRQRCSL